MSTILVVVDIFLEVQLYTILLIIIINYHFRLNNLEFEIDYFRETSNRDSVFDCKIKKLKIQRLNISGR